MINTSGINPTAQMVLIKCETVEEKTAGGIILPDAIRDREKTASQKGAIVAAGPCAGDHMDWPSTHEFPPVGSRVLIRKHSGVEVKGNDGADYRVCEDKDILAVLEG